MEKKTDKKLKTLLSWQSIMIRTEWRVEHIFQYFMQLFSKQYYRQIGYVSVSVDKTYIINNSAKINNGYYSLSLQLNFPRLTFMKNRYFHLLTRQRHLAAAQNEHHFLTQSNIHISLWQSKPPARHSIIVLPISFIIGKKVIRSRSD